MLAEEDLPYPKHDSPHSEHHGPKTPRPEHKRHDRPCYEQDGGRQAKHSRTRWVSPSHQSLIIMPPTRARCELRRIPLPRTSVNKGMKKGRGSHTSAHKVANLRPATVRERVRAAAARSDYR